MKANFYDGSIIGRRDEQQDAKTNLILPDGYRLYVLADGMGGQKAGQMAGKIVCTAFRDFFQARQIESSYEELQEAMEFSNKAIADVLREKPEIDGMGTTLIGLIINESTNEFSFISVGDSPLYILKQNELVRLNKSHSIYEDLKKMVAAGEMSEEEAETHPDRHAITSALMGKRIEQVDLNSGQLQQGELLLLASDGIHTLTDTEGGEIETILRREGADLEKAVACLLTTVEQKNMEHQDNTTVILIQPALTQGGDTSAKLPATLRLDNGEQNAPSNRVKKKAILLTILLTIILLSAGTWFWLSKRDEPSGELKIPEEYVSEEHLDEGLGLEIINGKDDATEKGPEIQDEGYEEGIDDHDSGKSGSDDESIRPERDSTAEHAPVQDDQENDR